MAAFRFFDPVPQFTKADGTLCSGGSLTFTASGTTTPKNVYSDVGVSVSLGNILTLDSDARYSEDPYLNGAYRVVLKDSDGVTIWTRDNVQDVASGGLEIPDAADGADGQALFTDGTTGGFYWDDVLTIPSQSGNSGKFLTTDGEALAWETIATPEEAAVSGTPASKRKWTNGILEQWGSGTAPTAASLHTSVAVTFGKAFDSAVEHVEITPVLSAGVTSNSPSGFPTWSYSSPATTGCTVHFFVGEENNGGTDTINSTIPFTYKAIGPCAVDPDA